MKKGFLQLSFLLVVIVLAQTSLFATGEEATGKYKARTSEVQTPESYLLSLRANQNTGLVDPALVIKASQAASASRESAVKWYNLGPDNYGGQTRALLFDNKDASNSTIYAGSMGGGIYKTINNGVTWSRISDKFMMVSCMVQDASGTIYVGTGDIFGAQEFNGLADLSYTTSLIGQGIFKSTDGQNFVQLESTNPGLNDDAADWAFVNDIAITNGKILAATNTGLKISTNEGVDWTIAKDSEGNELTGNAVDVEASSDGTIAVSIEGKLYISKTGDANAFVNVSTGEEGMLPSSSTTFLEVAIAPSDPNVMYASIIKTNGLHDGFYLSEDKGDTWTVILPASTSYNIYQSRGYYNNEIVVYPNDPTRIIICAYELWEGRKIYEEGLYAWDKKSNGALNLYYDSYLHYGVNKLVFIPGSNDTFFVGTDGGVSKGTVLGTTYSFSDCNRGYISGRFYHVATSGEKNAVLGGALDHGTVYVSGEGNTPTQGTWAYPYGGGFSSTYHGGCCAISTINPNAFFMSATAGNFVRSEDKGANTSANFPTSDMANADAFNTPFILWESYNDTRSYDSVTFYADSNYVSGQLVRVSSNTTAVNSQKQPFYHRLTQNLNMGDSIRVQDVIASKLFVAVNNKLIVTRQALDFSAEPEDFVIANSSSNFKGQPQSMGISKDADHAFVGMTDGRFYRVSNIVDAYVDSLANVSASNTSAIVTTTPITIYVPGTETAITQAITSISVNPNDANKVLVTCANYGNECYVFYSTNALSDAPTFVSKQGNLPLMPVYSSIIEVENNNKVFIGTEHGLYITNDITAANPVWYLDGALANIPVFELKQQVIDKTSENIYLVNGTETVTVTFPGTKNYGYVYAATYGGGLFRTEQKVGIDENPSSNVSAQGFEMNIYPNPVTSVSKVAFEVLDNNANMSYQVYDLSGRVVISQELGQYDKGSYEIALPTANLKSGAYILRLQSGQRSNASKFLVY